MAESKNRPFSYKPGDPMTRLPYHVKRLFAELVAARPNGCGLTQTGAARALRAEEAIDIKPTRGNFQFMGHCYRREPTVDALVEEIESGERKITKKALNIMAKYAYLKSMQDKAAYVLDHAPEKMNFAEQQNWDKWAQELGRYAGEGPDAEQDEEQKKLMAAIQERLMLGAGQVINVTPEPEALEEAREEE